MEKSFKYEFQVRGYELDSFGHVNNAVYLNYTEQARWSILNDLGLLDIFEKTGGFMIVVETNIKYINELKNFDKAFIETTMIREGFFLTFKQNIFLSEDRKKIAKSRIKCLFVSKERIPQDIPQVILPYINEHL